MNHSIAAYYYKYNPESGSLQKIRPTLKSDGTLCYKGGGGYISHGYRIIRFSHNGVRYIIPAHRLAWCLYYGKMPDNEIDHINGIRSDNRISNLRLVTHQENASNRKTKHGKKNLDLPVGIYKTKRKDRKGDWYLVKINALGIHRGTKLRDKNKAIALMAKWREEIENEIQKRTLLRAMDHSQKESIHKVSPAWGIKQMAS